MEMISGQQSPMAGLLTQTGSTRLTEETLVLRGTLRAPLRNKSAAREYTTQASGAPAETVELRLEIENRQRVHCVVTRCYPLSRAHASGPPGFRRGPSTTCLRRNKSIR